MSQTCRIKGALVFLCTCGLHTDTKSLKTSQSHRKNPQNGRFCTVPTGGAIYKNLRENVKKLRGLLSHTDWLASMFIDGTTGSNFNVLNLEYFRF